MDAIEHSDANRLLADNIIILEREAENNYNEGRYDLAAQKIQDLLDAHKGSLSKSEHGWYLQVMARYLYTKNRSEGMALQVTAHRQNKSLFLPPDGYQFTKIEIKSEERLANIKQRLSEFDGFEDLLVFMDDILARLTFGTKAEKFESAIDAIGNILGFNTERPDKNWKAGPDNLWAVREGQYLFIECKSEVLITRAEILKEETGQFNNNIAWFKRFYPGAEVKHTIIIPTKKINSNTGFNEEVYVLRQNGLKKLTSNVRSFILGLSNSDLQNLSIDSINQSLNRHSLSIDDILEKYFEQSMPSS
jgi:hypothetical protein